ncbi:bifunctional diguanylate cyclase/phosphodiesterase [Blastococcus sp. TF02A-26]|uniref:putative bifunctional diguanylate cyclase/phosphodiesterase n=1 Tax=Blastococcus sp. TF02A-26 TaxID=2250577 RepID=UPI000DE98196|nr:bifunctional diguanylate cyclase/phosphodiesterase [Blastococcus sp. TF02A-26]RBY85947.1 GGDEF-domain containing protein [Blastococcus sp. TF02A-26]
MSSRPAARLLPGAPLPLLAVIATGVALSALVAATDLSAGLERHSLLLAVPASAGLVAVLLWRVRRVAAERDVWWRLALGAIALGAVTAGAALLQAVPATHDAGPVVAAWAPALAYVFLYGGVVRWNRYGTEVADPDNLLTGVAAALSWMALTQAAVDGIGRPESLTGAQIQPLVLHIAVGQLLLITTLMQRVLGDLRRDLRPVLIALGFGGIELTACLVLAELTSPAWTPVAGALACLLLAVAATLTPKPATSRPSDAATSMAGAFVVIVIGTGALIASAVGTPSAVALTLGGLAVLGGAVRLLIGVRDLAQLTETRAEALTDQLTGLPNRRAVLRRMAEDGAAGTGTVFALMDLDRFKEVNDGLGHAAGDDLLRQVAQRLAPVLRTGDLLGRLGGDEFAVVASAEPGASPEETAEQLCLRLRACFDEPFLLGALDVHVGVSIGVTTGVPAGDDEGTTRLLREADTAMYDAKRAGGGHALYDGARHAGNGAALTLVEELRAGIRDGQLELHHQPQVDVGTGRVLGVEALVRWAHPRLGLLEPARFLGLAEAHGLMGALTDEVLEQAVRQLAVWRVRDPELRMSVNLSASDLVDSGLPARLGGLLESLGVPPRSLTLEVTEEVLLRDPERSRPVVAALRALGTEISIDDFGTGYCSLGYLRELSVSELKLDRSFTAGLLEDAPTEAIVASVIDLAHRLGLRVVAEGVEDEVTLARLAALGCDQSQGHLHGRPAPADLLDLGAQPVGS